VPSLAELARIVEGIADPASPGRSLVWDNPSDEMNIRPSSLGATLARSRALAVALLHAFD
jgi:hypothetical protein